MDPHVDVNNLTDEQWRAYRAGRKERIRATEPFAAIMPNEEPEVDYPWWPMDAGIPCDYMSDQGELFSAPSPIEQATRLNLMTAKSRGFEAYGLGTPPAPEPAECDPSCEDKDCPYTHVAQDPVDMVNLPPHYARFKIEPIRFIGENRLDWFQGNIVKYVLRHDAKNGMEDIAKVLRYATMYQQFLLGNEDWWRTGKPEDFKS